MQDIRNADCKTIGMVYVRALRRMGMSVEGITRFGLNQFSKRICCTFLHASLPM